MIPEPVCFVVDADGYHHLAFDGPPHKTVIDIHNLARLTGVKVTLGDGTVTIECDGRTLVYERIGVTLEGFSVCKLQGGIGA